MSKEVKVKTRKARKIKRKYEIKSIDKMPIIKEKLIRKNPAKDPMYLKNEQNSLDTTKCFKKKFYREIGNETINVKETPSCEELKKIFV